MNSPAPTSTNLDCTNRAPVAQPGCGGSPLKRLTEPWIWIPIAVVFLWFILIDQLRIEWVVNPQYSYGWAVPLLVITLLVRRGSAVASSSAVPRATTLSPGSRFSKINRALLILSGLAAFLILPLRLLLEANPNWRTPQWVLAFAVIGLTLVFLHLSLGPSRMLHFAFPICYMLVAVAWPPSVEIPLIQGLTRANAAATIELVGCLGIPASQHGNVIEIAAGTVGVSEACSGIRSFQSSIMVSLFLGEFYRLTVRSRLVLVLLGFVLAFVFNICRTSILVAVAVRKGIAAISAYHDPAGVSILMACTLGIWALALLLNRRLASAPRQQPLSGIGLSASPPPVSSLAVSHVVCRAALGLLVWLILLQVGVEAWYRFHESKHPKYREWTLTWPPSEPGFREVAIPEITWEMLKYNEGHAGTWISQEGSLWQLYYFRWQPGKVAVTSAWGHTPDVCLAAAGKTLRPLADNRCPMTIHSLVMPFRRYEYEENGQAVYVFHCLWEEHAPGRYFEVAAGSSALDARLRNVVEGRRNRGQRSIEIIVSGMPDSEAAQAAVETQLRKLISVAAPTAALRNPATARPAPSRTRL